MLLATTGGETDRERVVTRDEEDVEDGGGGEISGQQTAGVGKHGLGVEDGQAEEGDGPNPVEDLEENSGEHPLNSTFYNCGQRQPSSLTEIW